MVYRKYIRKNGKKYQKKKILKKKVFSGGPTHTQVFLLFLLRQNFFAFFAFFC